MKIGPLETKAQVSASPGERKSPAARAGGAAASATVDLSGVAAMKVSAEGEGAFDAAKVERIALAIREGRFRVDAGAIADQLIANAREVLARAA